MRRGGTKVVLVTSAQIPHVGGMGQLCGDNLVSAVQACRASLSGTAFTLHACNVSYIVLQCAGSADISITGNGSRVGGSGPSGSGGATWMLTCMQLSIVRAMRSKVCLCRLSCDLKCGQWKWRWRQWRIRLGRIQHGAKPGDQRRSHCACSRHQRLRPRLTFSQVGGHVPVSLQYTHDNVVGSCARSG